ANRTGSPLDHYLPAVRYLNSAGYQVLLTGDATINASEFETFRGGLVDARHAGVDNGIFSLFAGFEVDIFIGEAGGGSWLPLLKNVPSLMLNAFPYLFGLPNSWIYYKTARDSSGRLVHYADLWNERAYDYELAGLTIEENTAEQILEAVTEFVLAVAQGNSPEPTALSRPPDNIWMAHAANCAVSPAFARLFESSAVEPAIASE
ncbi:MAG: TIGR04372 family glycosyltransferase, partial [Chloroflexi bacterium]|nr:TIGR04372 family glycosyltransferase [Chloroflexota bacterium]